MEKKEFGKKMKYMREALGVSKYRIERRNGVLQRQSLLLESGESNMTLDKLFDYMNAIGLKMEIYAEIPAGESFDRLPGETDREQAIRYWIHRQEKEID